MSEMFCYNKKCVLHLDIYGECRDMRYEQDGLLRTALRFKYVQSVREEYGPHSSLQMKEIFLCEICKEAIEMLKEQ